MGEKLGDLHGNDDNAEKSRGKGAIVIMMVAVVGIQSGLPVRRTLALVGTLSWSRYLSSTFAGGANVSSELHIGLVNFTYRVSGTRSVSLEGKAATMLSNAFVLLERRSTVLIIDEWTERRTR